MNTGHFASLPCPVCGRKALAHVVEDCALSAGRLVKRLPAESPWNPFDAAAGWKGNPVESERLRGVGLGAVTKKLGHFL